MGIHAIVGTAKGGFVLRGNDARNDWTLDGPLFKGWKVTAATRDAGGRWYVGTSSDVYGPALHLSDDDGATWRQVERGPAWPEGTEDRKLKQIWTIVPAGDRVWLGVDDAGLFVSHDRGESWAPVEALNEHATRGAWFPGAGGLCLHMIHVDPRDHDRLWCGISAVGLFYSTDGGASWATRNDGIPPVIEDETPKDIGRCIHGLVTDPDDSNVMWRREHNGMFRSTDGGASWERIEDGLSSWFGFPISIHRATKDLFVIPLESDEYRLPKDGRLEVYRSQDGGASWHSASHGLPSEHCYAGVLRKAMDVDDHDPCGVYFGTTSGVLYLSTDAGASWQTMPWSLPRILSVTVHTT